jgi:hypothetical protein
MLCVCVTDSDSDGWMDGWIIIIDDDVDKTGDERE